MALLPEINDIDFQAHPHRRPSKYLCSVLDGQIAQPMDERPPILIVVKEKPGSDKSSSAARLSTGMKMRKSLLLPGCTIAQI
jgi:hypothetical protein